MNVSGYALLIIPLSVVRLLEFTHPHIGSNVDATIFVGTWFALAGFVDAFLFIVLRPDFGLQLPWIPSVRSKSRLTLQPS
jgi:hypothetical protein